MTSFCVTHPGEVCAPERGTGSPLGMRPRRCAQARVCPGAKATGYRVRLRPVSRRPVRGSRRIAPRFANVDRSLVRPFPHRRYAYRVRGRLRPVSRRPVRGSSRIAPRFANVDLSLQRPFPHRRFAYRVRGASPRAGPLLHRTRAHLAAVCASSEATTPAIFVFERTFDHSA